MATYQNIKVNVSEGQIKKLKKAIEDGYGASIELSHSDLNGEHVIAVTKQQMNKIKRAYEKGTGVRINLSKTQLMHNSKVEGGFIGALLPLLGTAGRFLLSSVVPSLATGLLSGVGAAAGNAAVNKITGNGIVYLKKNGQGVKVRAAGSSLFLSPWNKGSSIGNGMYLRSGNGYTSTGAGLLLGPNSPFANIPFLNWLL